MARFGILAARFNGTVVARLVEGAESFFDKRGLERDLVWVPGAFELPLAAKTLARTGRYDAIVCLGAVIRGETSHFQYVAEQAARGVMQAGLETGIPVLFGVLTTDTLKQASDRAGGRHGNKGWDTASAAVEAVEALRGIRDESG